MKKIFTIAIAASALLFVSATASAQYQGSRNMERRGQQVNQDDQYAYGNGNDQYDQRNDQYGQRNERRPKVSVSLSIGSYGGGYRDYNGYDRYHRYERDHRRYDRYDDHNRYRRCERPRYYRSYDRNCY